MGKYRPIRRPNIGSRSNQANSRSVRTDQTGQLSVDQNCSNWANYRSIKTAQTGPIIGQLKLLKLGQLSVNQNAQVGTITVNQNCSNWANNRSIRAAQTGPIIGQSEMLKLGKLSVNQNCSNWANYGQSEGSN